MLQRQCRHAHGGSGGPLVSLVAVRPEDRFEAARPAAGVAIRVRCAWENTTQGLPKTPISELVRLVVDGVEVHPSLVEVEGRRGALTDHYHVFPITDPVPGRHTATAVVRVAPIRRSELRSTTTTRSPRTRLRSHPTTNTTTR